MRRFHSYGPVDCEDHFCAPREGLIRKCKEQLVGKPEKGGHYFTIWAPRQTGKTWLMRRVKEEIEGTEEGAFIVGDMSMQGVILEEDDPDDVFFRHVPRLFRHAFGVSIEAPGRWDDWIRLFDKESGVFEKPAILFIDEFDSLPPGMVDRLVTLFRDMYLESENYHLHGLALIGVRAVLGVESLRGSPFNVQRSLQIPNLDRAEVMDLFEQYRTESGQKLDAGVVDALYEATRGQPGLVCWFGELLTETYNPGKDQSITIDKWHYVYGRARRTEWNNTLLNLIAKARHRHTEYVIALFSKSDIPFSLRNEWCRYLYLNGVIDAKDVSDETGGITQVCRFSSPFIQHNLYDALTHDLVGDRLPILALDPLDELADVFETPHLDLPALIQRYTSYLKRLKDKGLDPWKDQPRRADLHLTEAVGHFHLYAWLQNAVGRICAVSPEFPTGNGKVDLHLRCGDRRGIIEVKSFIDALETKRARGQAARYAQQMGLDRVTLVLFAPVSDEAVLAKLSGQIEIEGVWVTTAAIGWG